MTDRVRSNRIPSHLAWFLLLPLLLGAVLAVLALREPGGPRPAPPPARPALPAEPTLLAGSPVAAAAATEAERADATPAPQGRPRPDFAAAIDRLAALGEATAASAAADEIAAARASDAEARREFAELMTAFPDAGERAVDLLTTIAADAPSDRDRSRRAVLRVVLATECARRDEAGDRERLDALVHGLLAALPQNDPTAEVGAAVLDHRPWLRLCHEAAVLGLVDLAGSDRFPRGIATRLLLTLWDNLQRHGERSSADLAGLAMVLLADADPSKRTAACRQLLGDPRHRHVVLAWLRERRDLAVAAEISGIAARELPPAEALAVLREVGALLPSQPNAYLALGHRAPDLLADSYRELLAADTHAAVRADLVAGLAMADPAKALPIVELAQASDPAPAVRVQAMLTLTAAAAATHGEAACTRALDDPAVASDPGALAAVVFALQNLEAAGDINAVDRLGQRLRRTPLREDSRLALEQLLARALPGGQTSDARTGGR